MSLSGNNHACVFGLSWGDEGKGKVVDLLCPAFDLVVRFNGGANAGHTVCFGGESFALHLLPAGVLHDETLGLIGPGVVADPAQLITEMDELARRGIDVAGRLRISDRAHVVMPYHKVEDKVSERQADTGSRIGTTSRGIGPCYADKMKRTTAIRFGDLIREDKLADRVRRIVADRQTSLAALYGRDVQLDVSLTITELETARTRLADMICDTTELLHNAMDAGQRVLFEGANGMLLDVDHGTYPYVTSSSTGPHGIGPGAGVPAARVPVLVGTCKAYATRVGSGPFVSELDNDVGDRIRVQGNEFGTTTGRPRRCGWFDAVSCRYTSRLSGATDIAMMHLDTLSGIDPVGICTAYRIGGKTVTTVPGDARVLEHAEPVVELLPGWQANLREMRRFEDLPPAAHNYLARVEALVGVPITMVGVGPDRSETIVRGHLAELVSLPQSTSL